MTIPRPCDISQKEGFYGSATRDTFYKDRVYRLTKTSLWWKSVGASRVLSGHTDWAKVARLSCIHSQPSRYCIPFLEETALCPSISSSPRLICEHKDLQDAYKKQPRENQSVKIKAQQQGAWGTWSHCTQGSREMVIRSLSGFRSIWDSSQWDCIPTLGWIVSPQLIWSRSPFISMFTFQCWFLIPPSWQD